MKIITNKLSLYIFSMFILFSSCKKKGCTSETATNYNSKAKKDDGSCIEPEVEQTCFYNENAQSLVHNDIEREYVLYIPNSYTGNENVPLLFNFHGFGGSASDQMEYTDMSALAESDTFILVYPQGSCSDEFSHWNPSLLGGDNKSEAEDLDFTEAMIAQISSEYSVDSKRIYACGYSNGGMMAYGLANYKSDLFAAFGSVSGAMLDFDAPNPKPIIHLHGTSDGVIPYDGGDYYNSAQSVIDYWVDLNNTVTTPIVTTDDTGDIKIKHYLYDQGDNGISVEHYKYIGGDHVWFYETFQGKNASELIWDFVSRYDINGLR